MEAQPIITTDDKKISLLTAGIAGGLTGYAAKHALPLSRSTRAKLFDKDNLEFIENSARIYREKTYAEVLKQIEENKQLSAEIKDVFVKNSKNMLDGKEEDVYQALRGTSRNVEENVTFYAQKVFEIGKKVKNACRHGLESMAKRERFTPYYVCLGAAAALCGAIIYNAVKSMAEPPLKLYKRILPGKSEDFLLKAQNGDYSIFRFRQAKPEKTKP